MKNIKVGRKIMYSAVFVLLAVILTFYTNNNYFTAKADIAKQDEVVSNGNNFDYDYESVFSESKTQNSAADINLDNKVVDVNLIKQEILYNDNFSLEKLKEKSYFNDKPFVNELCLNKFEIAEWALDEGLINEEAYIKTLCDLIINRDLENVVCIYDITDRIAKYSQSKRSNSDLLDKINLALGENQNNQSKAIINERLYSNQYFTIHYDYTATTLQQVNLLQTFLFDVRNQFITWGFKTPILQAGESKYHVYLDPSSNGDVLATTSGVEINGNTSSSYITVYNFSVFNDAIKNSIVHEYFHAIQKAYNRDYSLETKWFAEATANLAEIMFTGSVYGSDSFVQNFINSDLPIYDTSFQNGYGYGAVIFPLTIYSSYGVSAIRAIYEEYAERSTQLYFDSLRTIINDGLQKANTGTNFDYIFRLMSGEVLFPRVWYNSYCENTENWTNSNVTVKAFQNNSSSISFTETINALDSEYFKIQIPANIEGMIEVNVVFSNSNGRVEQYREQARGSNIFFPSTINNQSTYADSGVGDFVHYSGIVLSNLGNSGTVNCTVTIKLTPQNEQINFSCTGVSRYLERKMFLIDGEWFEFNITFGTTGYKLIQTFGEMDTIVNICDQGGQILYSDDDSGYEYNSLISLYAVAGQSYTIKVRLFDEFDYGWAKLAIIPAYSVVDSGASMSSYESIWNFSDPNFTFYSYANQYYLKTITYTPLESGNYAIGLNSEFDNYLYVLDPRSTNLIQSDVDYNDDSDETNAGINKHLEEDVPYMIVYGPYNLNVIFSNLDSGDDLTVNINYIQ